VAASTEPLPSIAGYQIVRQLGSGGMGAVYLARRSGRAAPLAVKVMKAALGLQEQHIRRFWREVRVLMLQQHPGIVGLVDAGRTEDGRLFLATELVPGRDLFTIIQRGRALPFDVWLGLADQLLTAVHAAHQLESAAGERLGLVHRDLKPENVMVDWSGRVVVLDFGLAQARANQASTRITKPGQVMGTPKYMAPEQIVDPEAVGARTDQFAAAVVLYHAAVGRTTGTDLPNGDDRAPVAELWALLMEPAWKPLSTLAPQIPDRVDRVFEKAMAQDPSDRFGTVERFRRELLRVAGVQPATDAALGLHVQRLFPGEVEDPVVSTADITAASIEPTAVRSASSMAEATVVASAPTRPPGLRLGLGALGAALAAVAVWGVLEAREATWVAPTDRPEPMAEPTATPPPAPVAVPSAAAPESAAPRARRPEGAASKAAPQPKRSPPPTAGARSGRPAPEAPAVRTAPPWSDARGRPAENSHSASAWSKVDAALSAGDETAAARALRALEGEVPRATWNCIVQALKTKSAEEVTRSCR
jgi:serine/threonine-protein kinase